MPATTAPPAEMALLRSTASLRLPDAPIPNAIAHHKRCRARSGRHGAAALPPPPRTIRRRPSPEVAAREATTAARRCPQMSCCFGPWAIPTRVTTAPLSGCNPDLTHVLAVGVPWEHANGHGYGFMSGVPPPAPQPQRGRAPVRSGGVSCTVPARGEACWRLRVGHHHQSHEGAFTRDPSQTPTEQQHGKESGICGAVAAQGRSAGAAILLGTARAEWSKRSEPQLGLMSSYSVFTPEAGKRTDSKQGGRVAHGRAAVSTKITPHTPTYG